MYLDYLLSTDIVMNDRQRHRVANSGVIVLVAKADGMG